MMSTMRCNEIKNSVLKENDSIVKILLNESKSLMPRFGARAQEVRDLICEQYDKTASRYHDFIYEQIREELLGQLSSELYPGFMSQVEKLIAQTQKLMRVDLESAIEKGHNFGEVCRTSKEKNLGMLVSRLEKTLIFEQWKVNSDFDDIFEEIIYTTRKTALKELKENNLVYF